MFVVLRLGFLNELEIQTKSKTILGMIGKESFFFFFSAGFSLLWSIFNRPKCPEKVSREMCTSQYWDHHRVVSLPLQSGPISSAH